MPRGDGTGPNGMGPLTGRGAGLCAGFTLPGCANAAPGRGCGPWGRGAGGWGRRNRFYATGLPGWARAPFQAPPAPEQEAGDLRAQANNLRSLLEGIEKRLQQIEADKGQ